jgi:hypothetical protein
MKLAAKEVGVDGTMQHGEGLFVTLRFHPSTKRCVLREDTLPGTPEAPGVLAGLPCAKTPAKTQRDARILFLLFMFLINLRM